SGSSFFEEHPKRKMSPANAAVRAMVQRASILPPSWGGAVVDCAEASGLLDQPVCGAKVGFAEIFLMPQPLLLTRRGIICSQRMVKIFQSVSVTATRPRDTVFGHRHTHFAHQRASFANQRPREPSTPLPGILD